MSGRAMAPARPAVSGAWAPWTDKKGRFDRLRAAVFTLLLLPGLWLAFRWGVPGLGARPLKTAIHSTGYWALWLLVASLVVTPFKAITCQPGVAVIRRMVGIAALSYALIHLTLWLTDENWHLVSAASEIVLRFYLTIGAAVLAVLITLGVTSTDGMAKRLGTKWKTLHKTVYAAAALAMVHYYLQSKADVSQAVIASGALAWLLLWRALPPGRDRTVVPMLGLAAAAGLCALSFEFFWYRFGTHLDAYRVLRSEADVTYGLHPAALVFAFGLIAAAAVMLRQLAPKFGPGPTLTVLIYASAALWSPAASAAFGLGIDDPPELNPALTIATAAVVFALLGLARHRAREQWWRHGIDALLAACSLFPLLLSGDGADRPVIIGLAALLIAVGLALTSRLWPLSRLRAAGTLPLLAWLTFEAVGFLSL